MFPATNSPAQPSSPRFPVCFGVTSSVSLLCSFSKRQRWTSTPTYLAGGIFRTRRDLRLSRSPYCSSGSVWQWPKFSPTSLFSIEHTGNFQLDHNRVTGILPICQSLTGPACLARSSSGDGYRSPCREERLQILKTRKLTASYTVYTLRGLNMCFFNTLSLFAADLKRGE